MNRVTHQNSRTSYTQGREDGTFSKRQRDIIGALLAFPNSTDRQIMTYLCFEDMNAIRPRLSELVRLGVVTEVGSTKDQLTGKTVRVLRLKDHQGVLPL